MNIQNKNPKISIIVPVYNVEKYLDRCIQTLINQTLKEIEIILVDDGSPDNCPKICDDYAQKDSRIKVIHKINAGLGLARNSGLDIAIGEYVAFVDSDDFVELNMYEILYYAAISSQSDAVFCGFNIEKATNVWSASSEVLNDKSWEGDQINEFMYDMIASGEKIRKERLYQMSVWHAIYRRSIIMNNNIFFLSERSVVSEDIPFQVDFLMKAHKISYLNNHLYNYCKNNYSLSSTFKVEKFIGYNNLRNYLLTKKTDGEYKNRVNRLFIGYYRAYCYNLYKSNILDKKKIYKRLLNNEVWKTVRKEFHASFLPLHTRFLYVIMSNRTLLFLYIYIKLTYKLKK